MTDKLETLRMALALRVLGSITDEGELVEPVLKVLESAHWLPNHSATYEMVSKMLLALGKSGNFMDAFNDKDLESRLPHFELVKYLSFAGQMSGLWSQTWKLAANIMLGLSPVDTFEFQRLSLLRYGLTDEELIKKILPKEQYQWPGPPAAMKVFPSAEDAMYLECLLRTGASLDRGTLEIDLWCNWRNYL